MTQFDPTIERDYRPMGNVFAVYCNGIWRANFAIETHAESFILWLHDARVAMNDAAQADTWTIKTFYQEHLPANF